MKHCLKKQLVSLVSFIYVFIYLYNLVFVIIIIVCQKYSAAPHNFCTFFPAFGKAMKHCLMLGDKHKIIHYL